MSTMDVFKRMRNRFSQGRRSSVDPVRLIEDDPCSTNRKHRSGIPRLAAPNIGKKRSSSSDRSYGGNWSTSKSCNDGGTAAGLLFTPQNPVTPRVSLSMRQAIDCISQLSAKSHTARKDQRGALDKATLARLARHVASYLNRTGMVGDLMAGGQGRALSGAIQYNDLKNLNMNAFLTLFNFLYKELGSRSKVDFHSANYLEKIPIIAKRLSYNGAIYKSHLMTPSTPHSWPYVIAFLAWIVDLIEAQQPHVEFLSNDQNTEEMLLIEYVLKSYLAWINNESPGPPPEEYSQAFNDKIHVLKKIQPEVMEELHEKREKLKEMFDSGCGNVNLVKEEQKKAKENTERLVEEIHRLSVHNDNWSNEEAVMENKIDGVRKNNEILALKLEELRRETENLRILCSQQTLSKPEWDQLVAENKEIQAKNQLAVEKCEDIKKEIDSLDLRISSNQNKLDIFCKEMVEASGSLQPDSALASDLLNRIHHFGPRSSEEPEALKNFEQLQSTWELLLGEIMSKLTDNQNKAKALQDEMHEANNKFKEVNKEIESTKREMEDFKQYFQSLKDQSKEDQEKLTKKIQRLNEEVKFLSEKSSDDYNLELNKTKGMYNERFREFEESKRRGEECLSDMADMAASYLKVAMEKLIPFCADMLVISGEVNKYRKKIYSVQ